MRRLHFVNQEAAARQGLVQDAWLSRQPIQGRQAQQRTRRSGEDIQPQIRGHPLLREVGSRAEGVFDQRRIIQKAAGKAQSIKNPTQTGRPPETPAAGPAI